MRLFGSNGIRGIAYTELSLERVGEIGRALGSTMAPGSVVCVGNDARDSGTAFRDALSSGITQTGVDVVFLGRMPTPALAGTTALAGYAAGIMITASHNPPEYNGLKFFGPDGMGYGQIGQQSIEEALATGDFRGGKGRAWSDDDALQRYGQFILEQADGLVSHMRVVVDAGNGAMAGFASHVFREAGIEVIGLHDEPKSTPDRDAEPKPSSLAGTIDFVRERGADLAVCFDGDADRVVYCDSEGFLGFNELIGFVARERIKECGKRRVATTVETGRLVDLALADVGGEVLRGIVGDISVAHLTRGEDCAIGVEQVGHYINPEIGYYPDTLYTSLFLMSRIDSPRRIRDFYARLPRLHYEKAGVPCPNERMGDVSDYIERQAARFGAEHVNSIDGVRLEFSDAWMLLRPSGTQPLVRVIVEADSESRMRTLLAQGGELVRQALV